MKTAILIASISLVFSNCTKKTIEPGRTNSFNKNSKTLESGKKNMPDWFILQTKNKYYKDLNKAYLLSLFGKNEGC